MSLFFTLNSRMNRCWVRLYTSETPGYLSWITKKLSILHPRIMGHCGSDPVSSNTTDVVFQLSNYVYLPKRYKTIGLFCGIMSNTKPSALFIVGHLLRTLTL